MTNYEAGALEAEAEAFDKRIEERCENGFVADLRQLKPNDYFYKSFWRHPHYADLFVGEMLRTYLHFLKMYQPGTGRILDLGCGSGYFALELAREGHEVVGIDISESSINTAREALAQNTIKEGFGQLEYHVGSYLDAPKYGSFDAVLSSGFMHHMPNLKEAVGIIQNCLRDDGLLIWHEPQHLRWTMADASFVATIRLLLSAFDCWYEEDLSNVTDKAQIRGIVRSVHEEYVLERDPDEKDGQSPNDVSCDRDEILNELEEGFDILQTKPSCSFIYRMMGGLRGDQKKLNRIASLLALIDKTFAEEGLINANYFYGAARKSKTRAHSADTQNSAGSQL